MGKENKNLPMTLQRLYDMVEPEYRNVPLHVRVVDVSQPSHPMIEIEMDNGWPPRDPPVKHSDGTFYPGRLVIRGLIGDGSRNKIVSRPKRKA